MKHLYFSHSFTILEPRDLSYSETSCDGFWSSKLVNKNQFLLELLASFSTFFLPAVKKKWRRNDITLRKAWELILSYHVHYEENPRPWFVWKYENQQCCNFGIYRRLWYKIVSLQVTRFFLYLIKAEWKQIIQHRGYLKNCQSNKMFATCREIISMHVYILLLGSICTNRFKCIDWVGTFIVSSINLSGRCSAHIFSRFPFWRVWRSYNPEASLMCSLVLLSFSFF